MIKVEHIEVFNFEGAIRGMRNPMNSWDKSDSYMCDVNHCGGRCCNEAKEEKDCSQPDGYHVGKADLDLMKRLYKAGTEHRKYLRQIFVSMDITAPMYWFSEFDTYKIGTVANSTSKMHTIHKNGINESLFSLDGGITLNEYQYEVLDRYIHMLEDLRANCKSGDKTWRTLIQLLPESFNQTRTITMNYENVVTIIRQRTGHKLDEWNEFVDKLKELPYVREIIENETDENKS